MIKYSKGDIDPFIAYIKEILKRLNKFNGEITNEFTEELEIAIKDFESEIGQEAIGEITNNLLIKLLPYTFVPTNISYSSNIVNYVLDGLKYKYSILNLSNIGKSVIGKNIKLVTIGNGKHTVLYIASTHANEWITTPILLKFIEDLCQAYIKDETIYNIKASEILQNSTIYLVPLVNPDGVDLVNNAIDVTSEYYKDAKEISNNYPNILFPDGWKANIKGIDLNLQFPAKWEEAKEIKYNQGFTSPAPRDFVGNSPLEAPEAIAIYDLAIQNPFSLMLTYHTQGQVIFWKFLDYNPPKAENYANEFSKVSGYVLEETPYNSAFAGYKDWFIQSMFKPGFTIEAGLGQNPLPITDFDKIYKDNLGILVLGTKKI